MKRAVNYQQSDRLAYLLEDREDQRSWQDRCQAYQHRLEEFRQQQAEFRQQQAHWQERKEAYQFWREDLQRVRLAQDQQRRLTRCPF